MISSSNYCKGVGIGTSPCSIEATEGEMLGLKVGEEVMRCPPLSIGALCCEVPPCSDDGAGGNQDTLSSYCLNKTETIFQLS
jgi:hypothetical protein